MKKLLALFAAVLLLTGCTGKRNLMDRCMTMRARLLACESCSFDASVTADYGDAVRTFRLRCEGRSDGTLGFEVLEPETISGITGRFGAGKGELTFDDAVLAFPLLADDQITPVSGPWILLRSMLGGYLSGCTMEEDLLRLTIDDSYQQEPIQLDVWLDSQDQPRWTEILYDGRRIITMDIENFQIR